MKWVRDRTRRFQWRPYYDQQEIDVQCEEVLSSYWRSRSTTPRYPISTDDLTVLIEQGVSELDLYANLTSEGRDVEGVTEFHPRKKPAVRIAKYLSKEPSRENRLRSTLAHEYGHVIFHSFLWTLDGPRLPSKSRRQRSPRCRRARILRAPQTDWMEWQAGYAGGALLMPITPLKEMVDNSFREWGVEKRVEFASNRHFDLIDRIAKAFEVSKDAAGIRLLKLGYTERPPD